MNDPTMSQKAQAKLHEAGLSPYQVVGRESPVWAENEQAAIDQVAADGRRELIQMQMELITRAVRASQDEAVTDILEKAYSEMLDYVGTV